MQTILYLFVFSPYSSDINTIEQCVHRTSVSHWPGTPFLVRCTTCLMYNSFHGLVTIKFHRKHWIGEFVFGCELRYVYAFTKFLLFVMFNIKVWCNGTLAEYASRFFILTSIAVYIVPFWQTHHALAQGYLLKVDKSLRDTRDHGVGWVTLYIQY